LNNTDSALFTWLDYPARAPFLFQSLRLNSKQIALVSTFSAIGAVVRILVSNVASVSPLPVYGVVTKIGLSETLSFAGGFIFGPVAGFITGFLIILVSDIASPYGPGAWTPYIASIIGLLGICGGLIRRIHPRPTVLVALVSAVALTLLSEFLQNAWVTLTYNIPIEGTMITGLPSLVTAMANNIIFFPTVGLRTITFVQEHYLKQSA